MADEHKVWASSFADPPDVAAFRRCKADGHDDDYCFGKGDNGVGLWGDDCSRFSGAACALPPEVMEYFFGATEANLWREARNQTILVKKADDPDEPAYWVEVAIKDRMPHISTLEKKGRKYRIDLSPDAVLAIGKHWPLEELVIWKKKVND